MKIFQNLIISSKNSDQDLSYEGSNTFVGKLEVSFFSSQNMVIFCKIKNHPFLLNNSGSQDQANISLFFQMAQNITFSFPTKMFDPSKERS